MIKGTKAIIKTVQDKEQSFIKQLYVQKSEGIGEKEFLENLQKAIKVINATYPFVSAAPTSTKGEYIISIPLENREGHEFHFKHVAESFFCFLSNKNMPNWEKTNTLAKDYVTTKAVEVAKERK
mgnify:FL=1